LSKDEHERRSKIRSQTSKGESSVASNGANGGGSCSGGGGGKRARTIFTAEQLEKMEREFHKQVLISPAFYGQFLYK